jgi:hypothetical protein
MQRYFMLIAELVIIIAGFTAIVSGVIVVASL